MAKNVKVGVSVDTNSGVVSVGNLNKSFEKLNQSTQYVKKYNKELENSLLGLSKSVIDMNAHLTQAYQGYKALAPDVYNFSHSFIELNAQYEKTKKNIASLIATNSSNISSTGKVLKIQEKYQLSLKEGGKTLEKFNILSQKSGYAVSDLADIFQSFYAGAAKSMNFDQSVKSFENLMQTLKISGLGVEQLKMTIDGLGSGAVIASSDLGRFLKQIGLTNEAIKEANESGSLYELIMKKTSENVKVAELALGSYEDNVNLLRSNINKFKRELSEPLFENINQNLSQLNTFISQNEEQIQDFIKTLQNIAPLLVNIGIAYAGLKVYSKLSNILTKGFLDFRKSIIESTNALYMQKVQMLSNTQSINKINKKTLLLGQGFKSLANLAKQAIPLVLIERLLSLESALDRVEEKNAKINANFKSKVEFSSIDELKNLQDELENQIKTIENIGLKNTQFGDLLSEYTFKSIGDFYKQISDKAFKSLGIMQERNISDLKVQADLMQKLAAINYELENKSKSQIKLQNIESLNKELSNAVNLLQELKAPEIKSDKIEKTSKAVAVLNEKLLELVSMKGWENNDNLVAQVDIISEALANNNAYEEANNKQEALKKAEQAKKDYIERIKEQNKALKEISQIGLSEYDKKLGEINEKLKEWEKLGIDKNKLIQAEESLKINLDLESANKEFEEAKNLMIEFYESIGNKQEAWALKEIELREKYANLLTQGLIGEEDFKKMIKVNKDAYMQMGKDAKKQMSETEKEYNKMIANMQKTIESSFFDFINGKIKTLKDLFKDLGKTILQDFLSPYISALSGFLSKAGSGILGGLLPNFAFGSGGATTNGTINTGISSVVDFANSNGLKFNDETGKYEGIVNGTEVIMDKAGNIEQGSSVFNDISNIMSGADALEGIMSGEWIEKAGATWDSITSWLGSSGNAGGDFSAALADDFASALHGSGSDLITQTGSMFDNLGSTISNGFNSLFDSLGNWINSIGAFGSNLLANGSAYLANWLGLGASFSNGASLAGMGLSGASGAFSQGLGGGLGFIGGTLANAAMGGLLGYGIGSLGDWLFNANTHAGTGGAIGGAIGSVILPGIGTIVGGLLGSVIGGIFGKTKATGSGLQLWEDINFGDYFSQGNLQSYIDYEKKGWFSSKSWTEYQNINDEKIKEINKVLENQYATLVKLGANLDKFEIAAGKYANNSLFDSALPNSLLWSFLNTNDRNVFNQNISAIKAQAKENGISYAQQLANQFGTFMQMQSQILSEIYKNNPAKVAKIALDDTMYALTTSIRNATGGFELFGLKEDEFNNIAQISAEKLNEAFNESLRNDFSPENLQTWQNIFEAYAKAQEQVNNLLNSIIQKTQELMQINQSFLGANGISNSVFEVNNLMNSYAILMSGLKDDLSESEKEMLSDIFSANDKLLALGYEGLNEFLSTGNTELRKQLVEIITQFKQISDAQNGLIFSSEHLNKLAEVEKLINAYESEDGSKYADQVKLNENNKLLEKLNAELGILNSLGTFSANLINQTVSTSESIALNYDKILKQAKDDFKNGNLTSSSFAALQNAATQKANDIKNEASSFAQYQLEMLKMANEMKDLGGEADLNSIQDKIETITEENKKLQEKLDQTIKDTSNMTLEELKEYKKTLIAQSEAEIEKMIEYLGEDSPMSKYLRETIKSIKDGATLTETTLKNLQYALLQYQNNQENIDNDLNNEIKNPYKNYKAFADGGIVTRPTNALIGENGYPEAVIPLKDGKGLKIDASGVFEKISSAFEKAINNGMNVLNEKLELIAVKIDNVDKSVKRANMDLSILTKQTREIAENI
ncbi:hypothetical protein [Campylobacter sp. US33a]|uniref:hypothetical protein n=1 Tax=Campylobacter sp. US33a TaxID=2498120 RepID=UPI0010675AD6|nr:hypothetical protein [Campylobacter sp. US33a]TEY00368.1 hypothetical protein ELQ16_09300 [Campylobacter sp. US33a]